jgi:hypothetical protein
MVSKCANPECSAPFLYLHRGKLFRIDTEGRQDRRRNMGNETLSGKGLRRVEFYWLCDDCAVKMTVAFDKVSGVFVRPHVPVRAVPSAATAAAAA